MANHFTHYVVPLGNPNGIGEHEKFRGHLSECKENGYVIATETFEGDTEEDVQKEIDAKIKSRNKKAE